LEAFGKLVASLPYDVEAVQSALEEVKAHGGMELVAEACATVAAFESLTRVADATVRAKPPEIIMKVARTINQFMWNPVPFMTVALAIGSGVAAAVWTIKSRKA